MRVIGPLSQIDGSTLFLYRIADTSVGVARKGAHESENGVRGALDRSGRAETAANVSQAGSHCLVGGRITEQAQEFSGNAFWREIELYQFWHDLTLGD
jgi:hypothetical protein